MLNTIPLPIAPLTVAPENKAKVVTAKREFVKTKYPTRDADGLGTWQKLSIAAFKVLTPKELADYEKKATEANVKSEEPIPDMT